MKAQTIYALGFNPSVDKHIPGHKARLDTIARVTAEHKSAYSVFLNAGEFRGRVPGKQMQFTHERDEYPVVGDWVLINDTTNDTKIIQEILPRKTVLHKQYSGKNGKQLIAANIDVAFIVQSVDRDYSLNRLERYIVLAQEGGVKPVILLNKSDLISSNTLSSTKETLHARFGNIDVIPTSVIAENGLALLQAHMRRGVTYCFLGSSGVGKSSLINKLLSEDSIPTKAISAKSGRGKHTTTARKLYLATNGSLVIDNPGTRAVGVGNAEGGIQKTFSFIEKASANCHFANCTHLNEPGCAVLDALKSKNINQKQYENYQKLKKEADYIELNSYCKRQKDKKFGKYIKSAKKELKRYSQDSLT